MKLLVAAGAVALTLMACPASGEVVRGTVLRPSETIKATNKFGTVRISYLTPRSRKFEWDGQSRVIEMMPRPEAFRGELGLYDPAACWVMLLPLCKTPRLVVQEAEHDFEDYDSLYRFLVQESALMDWVYTSDGLVVGWSRSPQRDQINIAIRQLTVHGQKPVGLRGARNDSLQLID